MQAVELDKGKKHEFYRDGPGTEIYQFHIVKEPKREQEPKKLGDGTFGMVFEARSPGGDEKYALKVLYDVAEKTDRNRIEIQHEKEMRVAITVHENLTNRTAEAGNCARGTDLGCRPRGTGWAGGDADTERATGRASDRAQLLAGRDVGGRRLEAGGIMELEKSQDRITASGRTGSVERTRRSPQSGGGAKASRACMTHGLALGAALLSMAALAGCDAGPGDSVERASRNAPAQVSEAGARVALVIGNAAYKSSAIGRLENPVRDAESVAKQLKAAGFAVELERDLREDAFHGALKAFKEDSRRAATAAFYYAGHGMEQKGVNYLIPVDMKGPNDLHDAVELDEVIEAMQSRRNLVFLDACRTPPGRARGPSVLSRGLAAVALETVGDILISYASAPKKPALDGDGGGNSPYAAALAEHLGTPGQRLADLLMRVRSTVEDATDGEQVPWQSGSLRMPFYFMPGNPTVDPPPPPPPPDPEGSGQGGTVGGTRPSRPLAGSSWKSPLGMEFVWIPAGRFLMGSPKGEEGRDGDEVQHEVRISRGYWLGKYEVTQGEWEAVMGGNPSYFRSCGSRCPVERVSWDDIQEFMRKLNERESRSGNKYRLPSEAEWEYAARAGTAGLRYGELGEIAWYGGNSGDRTHPVGQKRANGWGLHDMLGNVWEWTADRYGRYPPGSVRDPEGPSSGSDRVARGGSWYSVARYVRSANRDIYFPGYRNYFIGFRLVRTE